MQIYRAICSACGEPLGIEDGRVPDSAMTSTKPSLDTFEPYRARLNQNLGNGSWCSKKIDIEDHLRIDLGQEYIINKIATEGGPFSIKKVFVNKTAPCK
ncbi:hypothetical protein AC249_AIPGENE19470 [Exaiptasia diaphana]|nr:hypothetical protein AC249_AIPGENE19470 [Exaiptasia diaphana]